MVNTLLSHKHIGPAPIIALFCILALHYTCLSQCNVFSGFEIPATGPDHVCAYTTVQFHCTVKFTLSDGSVIIRDAAWKVNGAIITHSNSNYTLLQNSNRPSQVVGLQINHAQPYNNGTEYTCTDDLAPDGFKSSVILNITGMSLLELCCSINVKYQGSIIINIGERGYGSCLVFNWIISMQFLVAEVL